MPVTGSGEVVTPAGQSVDAQTIGDLAEAVKAGQCILFLGAGVHHAPPEGFGFEYPEKERPPLGGELAETLAGECGFASVCGDESPTNLQRVALCYERQKSRQDLVNRIRAIVDDRTEPSPALRALAEMPFPIIMTTNYDTLFERALGLSPVRKRPVVGVYSRERKVTPDYPGPGDPSAERPFLFKMHGDINAPESIVVTDEDYIHFVLRMNDVELMKPIPGEIQYRLKRWPTLFVGYGLLDFNLRLLFRTLRWGLDQAQWPSSYSVDVRPDPLNKDTWSKEGLRFIVEDVWEFVPELYTLVLGRDMPKT
jgi:SIR2-like domain